MGGLIRGSHGRWDPVWEQEEEVGEGYICWSNGCGGGGGRATVSSLAASSSFTFFCT